MAKDIKTAVLGSVDTILADMVGVLALVVILYGALALPSLL